MVVKLPQMYSTDIEPYSLDSLIIIQGVSLDLIPYG
jgi:hypothetical protein